MSIDVPLVQPTNKSGFNIDPADADKNGIAASSQNSHVELIPARLEPDSITQMTTGGWTSSSDTIHWWY